MPAPFGRAARVGLAHIVLAIAVLAIAVLAAHSLATAADAIDDPDLQTQGEYDGPQNSMQVVALGDGEFDILVFSTPLEQRFGAQQVPRRLDGDEDTVATLTESLDVKRVERKPPSLGSPPPPGAIVLFDGTDKTLANWINGKRTEDGLLRQGTESKQTFRDYTLHLEFRTPWMPEARGQARGNSGVYHQGRYETQVLDSFGLKGEGNETGGIYGVKAPDMNACLPPMQWQTYDVDFTAARFKGDRKTSDARMTVRLNGVTVQRDVAVPKTTTAAKLKEGPEDGPIFLQDHGNEVRFRNIWVLPRDAEREAARPIVPGYERFFANAGGSDSLGGELLISTLGCSSCHLDDAEFLPAKHGPDLTSVASRVRGDALVSTIADPHKFKTGTTMPDPWMGLNEKQRQDAAEAIASYLTLAKQTDASIDRPSQDSGIRRGEKLYHSVGCVACHRSFRRQDSPRETTVPLGNVESKYTLDSLAGFIANPHAVRDGGRMPALAGSTGDAFAIASYLTRQVTRRENNGVFARRIYRGDWDRLPDFDAMKPFLEDTVGELKIKEDFDPKHTGIVFESQILVSAAGRYTFDLMSDDGSRLVVGEQVLDNDGVHGEITKSATFTLEAGLHPIRVEWFNKDGGIALKIDVTDPVRGKLKLSEIISDPDASSEPLLKTRFRARSEWVSKGQKLFQSAGCASCHAFGSQPPTPPAELPTLANVRTDRGCLASSVSRPAVDFHLAPQQRMAIAGAIAKRREASADLALEDEQLVHLTLAGLNCYACHRRGISGGPETVRDAAFQTTTAEMGWESRLPPPLDGVGDKLTDTYLTQVLSKGANERPYMLTRMPGFGSDHLKALHDAFVRLDRIEEPQDAREPQGDPVADGRKLVGATGLSCTKCHSYNNIKGGGLGAIDLLMMPERLRENWFHRYLQDPTRYRPGTRMPNSFPEGRSSYTKLYDGNPHQQIDAMWAYLSAGTDAKEPSGLRAGAIMLTAGDRPRIYRNFFEGISARGIAVGYPDELNLLWDAERMAMSDVWKSEFIDASRHWVGRGQGRTTPAGDQILPLEGWTPLALGDSIDMTWPDQTGREMGYRFKGYHLDAAGNPTFDYQISGIGVSDAIVPEEGNAFVRTMKIRPGNSPGRDLVWRMARAKSIQDAGDGTFQVGLMKISVTGAKAQLVTVDGQTELRVAIPTDSETTVIEKIQW